MGIPMGIPTGFPQDSYGDSHGDSHRIPMGMGWEWERKFHSHGNRDNRILFTGFFMRQEKDSIRFRFITSR